MAEYWRIGVYDDNRDETAWPRSGKHTFDDQRAFVARVKKALSRDALDIDGKPRPATETKRQRKTRRLRESRRAVTLALGAKWSTEKSDWLRRTLLTVIEEFTQDEIAAIEEMLGPL